MRCTEDNYAADIVELFCCDYYSQYHLLTFIKIIIAGAPASGKGTQCEMIKENFGVVHLSTGDMLCAAVAAKTAVGTSAKEYMDAGKLVPDEVIIGVVSYIYVLCHNFVLCDCCATRRICRTPFLISIMNGCTIWLDYTTYLCCLLGKMKNNDPHS